MHSLKSLVFGWGIFMVGLATGLASPPAGKIHLSYWEKWTGMEENAMQRTVDQFNRSQDRIVIDFLSVGQIEQKTLLSTAGGDPPDISGLYFPNMAAFTDRNALTPLDDFIHQDGLTTDQFMSRYAPAFRGMGICHGKLWGVVSTPTTTALYWNKDLFRAAGLDPEKPPRTVDELVSMSMKLTVRDASGNLKQIGFVPGVGWNIPLWFGGTLFDGKNVTIGTDPVNLQAFRWFRDFTNSYGMENLRRLTSTFGSLSTPQDPFTCGQVAMVIDGVWRNSYIQLFGPGMNYGVAGWPAAQPGITDFTTAEADMLVIPRGAKHPREAWEFLKYISSPNLSANSFDQMTGTELLSFLQKKASPLEKWSPYFEANHPNPDIKVFRQLAESPHAVRVPDMGIWDQYQRELNTASDEVRLGLDTPEHTLQHCQERVAQSWAWHIKSMERRQAPVSEKTTASADPSPATTP